MPDDLLIRVTDLPLDTAEALAFVAAPEAGGITLFAGTVRDHSEAGPVLGLDYEAWQERAERVLREIGREMLGGIEGGRAAVLHRFGSLDVGEISVIVCCSSAHRDEAFRAARLGIERVKKDAPIWKRERLGSGEARWVMGS